MKIDYINDEALIERIRASVPEKRFSHILGVIEMAQILAKKNKVSLEAASLAALCHDYCKYFSNEELIAYAREHQLLTDEIELKAPFLLHGPVAAQKLWEEKVITSVSVYEAIRYHTTGHPDLDVLGKIIYVADAVEAGRHYPSVEKLRKQCKKELDLGCLGVLDHTIAFLLEKKTYIHPFAIQMRNKLLIQTGEII